MKTRSFSAAAFAAALGLASAAPLAAQTTFHKYVANGDSITAGVQGNCLVGRNQRTAYPVLVANSLGITDFQLPLVAENGTVTNPATACLGATLTGVASRPIAPGPVSQPGAPLNATLPRPYDDLGMPSAKAADLVDLKVSNPTAGGVQASAALVLRNFPGGPFEGKSAVDETNLLTPDIVSLWIGNNDVLNAALSGVAIDGVTMTPKAVFDAKYAAVVAGLRASGRTLVLLNVPDVAAVPFTTTVGIDLVSGSNRIRLLGPGNAAYPCPSGVSACPLPDGSLLTLQAASQLAVGRGIPVAAGGTGQPLPDGGFTPPSTLTPGVILYPDEIAAIRAKTADINATIASQASSAGAILIDIHAIFDDIKANGYTVGGITFNASLLTGGLFSADGFHPSNVAHAIIADEIIKAINANKGTSFPEPNFSTAFFAANVPPSAASALTSTQYWQSLFAQVPAQDGVEVSLPAEDRAAPVAPSGPGRGRRGAQRGAAAERN
jgi:lysophospholipase L1-like esterase